MSASEPTATAMTSGKRMRRVAIVGGAWTRKQAPYDDAGWDIWAFSSLRLHTPRITRWFEMHAPGDLRGQLRRATRRRHSYASYVRFLRRLHCPVYVQRTPARRSRFVTYPITDAVAEFGRCFSGTASYMLALAIMEQYDVIGLWGVHLDAGTAFARQRPAVEYLLGVARQRGIELYVPDACSLRVPERPRCPRTDVLYGYDWRSRRAWWRRGPGARRRRVALS